MIRPRARIVAGALLVWGAGVGTGHAQAANGHVHGQAELEVVVEGDVLGLTLRSPLDSLLGFELEPRTASQKAAARSLVQQLRDPAGLFKPTPAAGCVAEDVRIDAPALGEPADPRATGRNATGVNGHAELVAVMRFRCRQPAALRGLETGLFERHRRLQRVDARVVGPRGQSAARLAPARPALSW